jgi:hypothetical protein
MFEGRGLDTRVGVVEWIGGWPPMGTFGFVTKAVHQRLSKVALERPFVLGLEVGDMP